MTKTQKELKELYKVELSNYWKDEKMVKHCLKEADYIIELEDNSFITVDRPRIKKDFCFGYSDSRYDTKDYDRANDMVDYARKSQEYFIEKNLQDINRAIEQLESGNHEIWVFAHYHGQDEKSKLRCWTFKNYYHDYSDKMHNRQLKNHEIKALIEAYKEVEKQFTKRLNTYLKRYGLTKINAWSYWRDA